MEGSNMATAVKRAGRKVSTATRSRIEAAGAIRGFVSRHEEVIRYLEEVQLIQSLLRVRENHRPRSGQAVQVLFVQRDSDEMQVEVRLADGTVCGTIVLRADFLYSPA